MDNSEHNFTIFACCDTEMSHDELKSHLQAAHGITGRILGDRTMLRHLDAAEWFQSDYGWTVGDLVFYQSVRTERAKSSFARLLAEYDEK